jgi:hypothetical protein
MTLGPGPRSKMTKFLISRCRKVTEGYDVITFFERADDDAYSQGRLAISLAFADRTNPTLQRLLIA